MCGIVGLLSMPSASPDVMVARVTAMADRIAHRGPDGGGVAHHEDATLGMRRLAIVDIEHGRQPMHSDDGAVVIVYNGEIFNAPSLRRRLQDEGVRFRTTSDTEVILRLYERDPDDVERHLVGMWAFAIHDRRRRTVTLSRDRFGIKPLFVVDTGTALAFASELRCFDRHLHPFDRHFVVDPSAAHAMISWSYVPEEGTIYEGVERLAPATRWVVDLATGVRKKTRYWYLEPSADAGRITHLDEAVSETERVLRRSVHEHLESDVPVATYLSGGIDSSLVTQFAVEAGRGPLEAFAIGFEDPRFDESPYARETARMLGIPIVVRTFDEATALRALPSVLLAYDEPFGDSSSLATFLVSQHIATKYKVALGGDGGDEVFAGYKKHLVTRVRKRLRRVPQVRDALGKAIGRLPARADRTTRWAELLRTAQRVAQGLEGGDSGAYVHLTQVASLARTASLVVGASRTSRFERIAMDRFDAATGTELQRTLASDLANVLPNDMLVKVDRASMAVHLEARPPFLDHRVVEFGVGLREEFTLGTRGKRVLRTLHEKRFGPALANRKKQGFQVPVERWLRTVFDPACETLFERRRLERYGLLSTEALSNGRFRTWREHSPMILWNAFALASWCEANLGDGPDSLREILGRGADRGAGRAPGPV
ncbi:MAG: asparagine synthase (glutamine-hydrolyzing) [Polyangiaceae bacterium]